MRVVNPEGLGVGVVPGRIGFPGHSMTVVIKSVWALEAGRVTTRLEDHPLTTPTGDLAVGEEDGDPRAALRYANDLLPWKPRADVLLVGHCRPPGGRPVRRCPVEVRVGRVGCTLEVHGDRWWDGSGVRPRATEAAPFTEMPLGWDRAWGGPGIAENPAGKGAAPIRLKGGGEAWPLPNLERADQPLTAPDQAPVPGGVGPIPATWAPRAGAAGTYDDRWLQTRWPWFAEDLDPSFFLAAPPGMRAPGSLRGDEPVLLRNVVAGNPEFESRLPGQRVRCFLHSLPEGHPPPPRRAADRAEWEAPPPERMRFEEVGLSLDTVWMDGDEGVLVLVWRGHTAVSGEGADEVMDLFVMSEPLSEVPSTREEAREAFLAAVAEDDGEEADVEEAAAPEAGDAGGPAEAAGPTFIGPDEAFSDDAEGEIPDLGADPFGSEGIREAELAKQGLPPSAPPTDLSPEEEAEVGSILRAAGQDEAAEALAALFRGDEEDEVSVEDPEPDDLPWTREAVAAALEAGDSLEGEELSGLDLSGMDFGGADLREARLVGTTLRESVLTDVVATGACLDEADLSGVELKDALLDGVSARGARLDGASCRDASLVGANLSGASLRGTVLAGAVLSDATLDDADLTDASLADAEFDGGRALRARFHRADLEGFRGADALDLSEADFTQARAPGSIWSGARLRGALFPWALLEEADFSDADLEGADFWAARLRFARFERSSLVDARLARADGFEMNFEEADLLRTDLRGGSFYQAEFLGARLEDALARGADLGGTKHG